MTPRPTSNRSNRDLLQSLRAPKARFYPFDLHTHSLGSYDVCFGQRYEELPETLRQAIESAFPVPVEEMTTPPTETQKPSRTSRFPLKKEPSDHCAHDRGIAIQSLVEVYFHELVHRRDKLFESISSLASDNWSVVALTDHNTAHFSTLLASHAWQQRSHHKLIILPGVELDTRIQVRHQTCPLHILCLFQPGITSEQMTAVINRANTSNSSLWSFGTQLAVTNLADFIDRLRNHHEFPSICIAAHVGSNKGIEKESKKILLNIKDAEIARLEGALRNARDKTLLRDAKEYELQLEELRKDDRQSLHHEVLRVIGHCGFDALQIQDRRQETHYRKLHRFRETAGRAVPLIASDAHTPSLVFDAGGQVPYIKLNVDVLLKGTQREVFEELRSRAIRFAETRTTYFAPGHVGYWIEGLEIIPDATEAEAFWEDCDQGERPIAPTPFTLALSRNLNCFIGGRGSGKSSLIEAIAFACDTGVFNEQQAQKVDRRPDWYRRSEATLKGCQVRLIWKTTADNGFGGLSKKALFVSRYFNSTVAHPLPECRDAQGHAITDAAITAPRVQLLRAHEIERTAETGSLRNLLDQLSGDNIIALSGEVERIRQKLKDQRKEILSVCAQLSAITAEKSPLRQYGLRKLRFDAVNKPDLRKRFELVDEAEAVSGAAKAISDDWARLGARATLQTLESRMTDFFRKSAETLVNEAGDVLSGHESLYSLFAPSQNPAEPAVQEKLIAAVQTAGQEMDVFSSALKKQLENCVQFLSGQRDELSRDGLPAGANERHVKKQAFDEANRAYESYKELIQEYDSLMEKRLALFDELVTASQCRTQCRKDLANRLTTELERDLDLDVLRITVTANPLRDTEEFSKWMDTNLSDCFSRYRKEKMSALMNAGLMPSTLRRILLSRERLDLGQLQNNFERAAQGRIDQADCDAIADRCRAFNVMPLDESNEWKPGFLEELPPELRTGVLVFNKQKEQLTIDQVLQLDEVVIDDQPQVLLNDRPTDEQSIERPLHSLSPGQRCSAILPLLLLSGDCPLIIDQPEENLDNRLIRQVIVNILASMKLRRQVIIATHNPNLPVLGDAEQCVVLQASGRDRSRLIATGSLDSPKVSRYITDIMEGGREAFQYRQSIYQTHWSSVVEEE